MIENLINSSTDIKKESLDILIINLFLFPNDGIKILIATVWFVDHELYNISYKIFLVGELQEQSRVLVEEVHQVQPLDNKDLALLQRYDGCSQQIVGDDTIQFPEEGARSIKLRYLLLRAINELELSFGQQERKLCRFTHRPQDLVLFNVSLLEDHFQ